MLIEQRIERTTINILCMFIIYYFKTKLYDHNYCPEKQDGVDKNAKCKSIIFDSNSAISKFKR